MNICVDCQNPINTCSWEREFKPVPGWIATKTIVKVQGCLAGQTESYDIHFCPLFTPPKDYNYKTESAVVRSMFAKNVKTGEITKFPSIGKAAQAFGVTRSIIVNRAKTGRIINGHRLEYEKRNKK